MMTNCHCSSLVNLAMPYTSSMSKNYLAVTKGRGKAGWIHNFSKNKELVRELDDHFEKENHCHRKYILP